MDVDGREGRNTKPLSHHMVAKDKLNFNYNVGGPI